MENNTQNVIRKLPNGDTEPPRGGERFAGELVRVVLCLLIIAASLVLRYSSNADVAASVNPAVTGDSFADALTDVGRNITDARAWARLFGFETDYEAVSVNGG